MDLNTWCNNVEEIELKLGKEYFKMSVGLKYSKKKIGILEKINSNYSKVFLKNFKEPKEIYYDAVIGTASESLSKSFIKLNDLRRTKIVSKEFKFEGKPVNWNNWKQFASNSSDEDRKKIFDDFMEKSKYLAPVVNEISETYRQKYKKYNVEILEPYLYSNKVTYNRLKNIVNELGSSLKKESIKQYNYYSNEINGRDGKYFDDYYYLRNAVFNKIKVSKKFDILQSFKRLIKVWGFNINNIHIDSRDRPNKYASPFCDPIGIPHDVRVSLKSENFVFDLNNIYHELGHAIHFSNIREELPYWKKYHCSEALYETFSTFFENLIMDTDFLIDFLGFQEEEAKDIVRRMKFLEIFVTTFYSANSIFKMDYWKNNLTIEEANESYSKLINKYMGFHIDGRYWLLHHILPEDFLYVPSYLLAAIRANEMKAHLSKGLGKYWFNEKETGVYLRKLMVDGIDSPISSFNECNPSILIKNLLTKV